MLRGALVVLCLCCTLTAAVVNLRAQSKPRTAAPAQFSVAGAIQEFYTKQPYASRTIGIRSYSEGCVLKDRQVKTDQDGRFQFDEIPACRTNSFARLRPFTEPPCAGCSGSLYTAEGVVIDELRFAQRDLGTVFVANDEWLATQFRAACAGAALPTVPLHVKMPVLIHSQDYFSKQRGWKSSFATDRKWMLGDLVPWPALLCMVNEEKAIGVYVKPGQSAGPKEPQAFTVTTRATLLRFSDGKSFTTTTTAEPPKNTAAHTVAGRWGDTKPAILAWLKQVAKDNP
jgi:hypothetical protein